jgi:hypothetical protein
MPFIGFDARYRKLGRNEVEESFDKKSTKDKRIQVSLGLPLSLFITAQAEVYHDGIFVFN